MRNLDLHYSWQLKENGLIVRDSGIIPAHSFTKQFAQLIFNSVPFWLSASSPQAMTDTDGSSITVVSQISGSTQIMFLRVDAAVSISAYGIQVGTGTGAESINDTALGVQIATGTSAGQLQYGTVTFAAPSTTATTTTFRITRVFTNGSGGTVTVQEIGLASRKATGTAFLLIRDLTGVVAVTNGQQLTVNYDMTTTI